MNIILTFDNLQDRFRVPAIEIAKIRGKYYADADLDRGDISKQDYGKVLKEEVEYGLDNKDELKDWIQNNMNWVDIEPYGEWIPAETEINMQDEFLSCDVDFED